MEGPLAHLDNPGSSPFLKSSAGVNVGRAGALSTASPVPASLARGRLASYGLAVGSAGVADVLSTPCTGQEASSGPGRGPSLMTHHPLFQSVVSSFFMML